MSKPQEATPSKSDKTPPPVSPAPAPAINPFLTIPLAPLPLLGSTQVDRECALADAHAEFNRRCGKAGSIIMFFEAAQSSPQTAIALDGQMQELFDLAETEGILSLGEQGDVEDWKSRMVAGQIQTAREAVAVAALTLWHSALDDYLHRLLRLAAILNRPRVLSSLTEKRVRMGDIHEKGQDAAENNVIEAWLSELERASMPKKWGTVFAITPPTPKVRNSKISFDPRWLEDFDEARHNGAHGDGSVAATFDLNDCRKRLSSYGMGLWIQYATAYGLKVDSYRMFGAKHPVILKAEAEGRFGVPAAPTEK